MHIANLAGHADIALEGQNISDISLGLPLHEKESKRNSEKEALQGNSKRKVKQPKNVVKDKKTDTPMDKTQDKFVSDQVADRKSVV